MSLRRLGRADAKDQIPSIAQKVSYILGAQLMATTASCCTLVSYGTGPQTQRPSRRFEPSQNANTSKPLTSSSDDSTTEGIASRQ
jgi:hypothetical protein